MKGRAIAKRSFPFRLVSLVLLVVIGCGYYYYSNLQGLPPKEALSTSQGHQHDEKEVLTPAARKISSPTPAQIHDDLSTSRTQSVSLSPSPAPTLRPTASPTLLPTDNASIDRELDSDDPDTISSELFQQLVNNTLPDDEYYARLRPYLWRGCGDLCNFSIPGIPANLSGWTHYQKIHDCPKLYKMPFVKISALRWPPPEQIPKALRYDFTMGGTVDIVPGYIAARYSGTAAMVSNWTQDYVESWIKDYKNGKPHSNYGAYYAFDLGKKFKALNITGQHWLVIGSENPWVEAILLAEGAGRVTTLEYGFINSTHPRLDTILPSDFDEMYLKGTLPVYDGATSFSSIEHSGLGRYGDFLNPYGDVIAISKVWCSVKPGGHFVLALSFFETGHLVWNAHRFYAPKRFSLVTPNWQVVEKVDNEIYDFVKVSPLVPPTGPVETSPKFVKNATNISEPIPAAKLVVSNHSASPSNVTNASTSVPSG